MKGVADFKLIWEDIVILVTGGAGYIGSHTCVALARAGLDFVLLDNFSNSERAVLQRLEKIVGRSIRIYEGDIRNRILLQSIFEQHTVDAVIHFAGLKAVGESSQKPLDYYSNNVEGTLVILDAMARAGCRQLVFSSSATVYGDARNMPIREDAPCSATNPYGRTKLMIEEFLHDLELSDPAWKIARLRYFNPVGAHESGLLGENPRGIPNNLMPYVTQVAVGVRERLQVFGNDYPTPDGTGVRDYIHVMDLAEGHVAALTYLQRESAGLVVNLGTGRGTSVLEMIRCLEKVSGRPVPFDVVDRRPGDVAVCYADVNLARETLGWTARRGIDDMCQDAWRWQSAIRSVGE